MANGGGELLSRIWHLGKWVLAGLGAVAAIVGVIVYGKKTPRVLAFLASEKEAKAKRLQVEADYARAQAKKAKNEAVAQAHTDRADTLQLRIVDIKKAQTEITGDLTEAAESLSDDEYADDFNTRHASAGGGPKP